MISLRPKAICVGSAIFDSTNSADERLSARKNTQATTTATNVRTKAATSAIGLKRGPTAGP